MRENRIWAFRACAVALALLFAAGCSDDNGGTAGPDDGVPSNPVVAAFTAVARTTEKTLSQNTNVLQSLEFFGPMIIESFGAPLSLGSSGSEDNSRLQSCIRADMQGKIFRYDLGQGQYTSATDPAVPAENVRYVLYRIAGTGTPSVPLTEIGYLEAECRGQLPTDTLGVTVSRAGVNIIEIELRGISVNPPSFIFGASPITLRDSLGVRILDLLATAEGTVGQYLDEAVEITGGLEEVDSRLVGLRATIGAEYSPAQYGLLDPPFNILAAGVNQSNDATNSWWRAAVSMIVPDDGSIQNILQSPRAPLEYEAQTGSNNSNGIYACFSGQYDAPLVQRAESEGGCSTGFIDTPLPLTVEELQAIRQGYLALLSLLETVTPMWEIGMGVMAPQNRD